MTASQAYDLSPVRPVRTELDLVRTWDAVRASCQRLLDLGYEPREIDYPIIAWNCFVRAAQTERSLPRPRPSEYGSSMPEVYRTTAEEFINRIERLKDKMEEYEVEQRPTYPTAAAIQEYEEVTLWLRFVYGRDRERDQKIIWLRAKGMGCPRLGGMWGISAKTVSNIRTTQLGNIGKRLHADLLKVGCNLGEILY